MNPSELYPSQHNLQNEQGYLSPNPSPRNSHEKGWSFSSLEGRSPIDANLPHRESHYHLGRIGWEIANQETRQPHSSSFGFESYSSPHPSPQNSYANSFLESDNVPITGGVIVPWQNDPKDKSDIESL